MNRISFSIGGSSILLILSVIIFPDQFLFSKVVPHSFWTKYFPLPFGAGWFITYLMLVPVVWGAENIGNLLRRSVSVVVLSFGLAVPMAMGITGSSFSLNNLFNQYMWVSVIGIPPLLTHIAVKWCILISKSNKAQNY